MPKHVFLLEQATSLMILCSKFTFHAMGTPQGIAFNAQFSRAVNSLISVRELILNGFEDTAKVISRNFIESLDISLAVIIDKEFAIKFLGDDSIDYDILWKKEIGYGNISKYIKKAFELAELPEKEAMEFIQQRKITKNILSKAVHADEGGAFRSLFVSPLGIPGVYSTKRHGVISYHSANHISFLIYEVHHYIGLLINCLIKDKLEFLNQTPKENHKDLQYFIDYALIFQSILNKYDLPKGETIISKDMKINK